MQLQYHLLCIKV